MKNKISIIAAVSIDGIIGKDNKIPWSCPEDMAHFRSSTLDSTIIMGRKTFESMGSKCLPKRNNILVSNSYFENSLKSLVCKYKLPESLKLTDSLTEAIEEGQKLDKPIFLIGGSFIYQQGLNYADEILLSVIPEHVGEGNVVRFPWINPLKFDLYNIENKSTFSLLKYVKKV